MMPVLYGVILALSSSLAATIVAKATVTMALALIGARLARRSRAAVRHALLAGFSGCCWRCRSPRSSLLRSASRRRSWRWIGPLRLLSQGPSTRSRPSRRRTQASVLRLQFREH